MTSDYVRLYKRSLSPAEPGGLVISRKIDESIDILAGEVEIQLQVVRITPSVVRLRLLAPRGVAIVRSEIRDRYPDNDNKSKIGRDYQPDVPQISDADREIIAVCSEQGADPPADVKARGDAVKAAVRLAALQREGIVA